MVKDGENKTSPLLVGESITRLVSGNRVVIPMMFRAGLGLEHLIITRGYEDCLILLNQNMWSGLIEQVRSVSYFQRSLRETTRFLVGSANQAEPDNQGRVVLTTPHLAHLGMKGYDARQDQKIVFVGLLNWIEVWSYERWMTHNEYLTANSEKIAQELNNLVNYQAEQAKMS